MYFQIEISDIGGLKFGGAKIIPNMSNNNVGKGVIHLIDTVLYPLVLTNETKPEKNPSKNQTTYAKESGFLQTIGINLANIFLKDQTTS